MNRAIKWAGLALAVALAAGMTMWSNADDARDPTGTASESRSAMSAEKPSRPYPGYLAPEFVLTDLEGNEVKLSSLQGKKLFINFWASWCPPCKAEMPDVVKMSEKNKGQVEFYGMNLTTNDKIEGVKQFVQDFQIEFPTLLDQEGSAASMYAVMAIPTSLTIDEKGTVVERIDGQLSAPRMEEMIGQLIAR